MSFFEDLQCVIKEWNTDPIEDEWLFENFRAKYVNQFTSDEAFLAIGKIMDTFLKEEDESTVCEILQTIIGLASKSQTTEVPKELIENREIIDAKVSCYGDYAKNKLKELYAYYRL